MLDIFKLMNVTFKRITTYRPLQEYSSVWIASENPNT